MARFRCRACCAEGDVEYRPGQRSCPLCGSGDVQLALAIAELPDDDPLLDAMRRLADGEEE